MIVSKILFVVGQVILTQSFVFRLSDKMVSGNLLYFIYRDNQNICLKACYEEINCTYVVYGHERENLCELYSEGDQLISGHVYKLSRQETDAMCQTLDVATTITFRKIPPSNNVSRSLPWLSFSRGPRSGCTAVPVFRKTVLRRFYFGSIYNTTGYYFANAYVFADYCSVDCVGTQEIREYVDADGNYMYEDPAKAIPNLKDSGLGQTFYVASVKPE